MGVTAALFTVLIAVTGLLLNHTEDFQFDSHYVHNDWLLDWYGIRAPDTLLSFSAHDQQVTLMGEHLYLSQREIDGEYSHLVGAAYLDNLFVIAINDAVLLLTDQGEIVERLRSEDGLPAGIRRIGTDKTGRPVVENSLGYYQADKNLLRWRRWEQDPDSAQWARPTTPGADLAHALRQHYRGEVLPVERVLLDLHSGRFFGSAGPWLFDIAALLLILLSLTGTFIWLQRKH